MKFETATPRPGGDRGCRGAKTIHLSFGFLRASVPPWCKGLVVGCGCFALRLKEITQCSFLRRNADYKWFMILRRGDPGMALHLFYGFAMGARVYGGFDALGNRRNPGGTVGPWAGQLLYHGRVHSHSAGAGRYRCSGSIDRGPAYRLN